MTTAINDAEIQQSMCPTRAGGLIVQHSNMKRVSKKYISYQSLRAATRKATAENKTVKESVAAFSPALVDDAVAEPVAVIGCAPSTAAFDC